MEKFWGHSTQKAETWSQRKTIKGFCRVTHRPNLPQTVLVLAMKGRLSPRQTRTVGHPSLERLFITKNWKVKILGNKPHPKLIYCSLRAPEIVHLHEKGKRRLYPFSRVHCNERGLWKNMVTAVFNDGFLFLPAVQ